MSLALGIVGLALFDSTSFGTSLLPLWLLLLPGRVRVARMTAYLLTLGLSYFIAGVLVALGAAHLLDALGAFLSQIPDGSLAGAQITGGLVLLVVGGLMLARARRARGQPSTGALLRWREHAMTAGSAAALARLAALAFAVEFATMVPYLAAIGMLTTAELPLPAVVGWIAAYCLIMILPATVATLVRVRAHDRIEPALERLDSWLSRNSPVMSGTAFALIGAVLIADGVPVLIA
ncbi:GAP family protein [Kytococcus sedentarius]|uniref:GAP family protein n=1 Tax=Kytococcus sedentarius TaxID=1276 RepID=UPI0038794C12